MTPYGGVDYFSDISPTDYSFGEKLLCMMVSFIYTFHMPLFMMLGGACFSLTIHKVTGLKAFVSNKARRLLVPFLFTTLLLSVPLKYMSGYYSESANVLEDIVLPNPTNIYHVATYKIRYIRAIRVRKTYSRMNYIKLTTNLPNPTNTYRVVT